MERKNPILNFRLKSIDYIKVIGNSNQKNNSQKKQNLSSLITRTRESIDMTECS